MTAHWTAVTPRRGSSTCRFRMMPTDDYAESPSDWTLDTAAAGNALRLEYSWVHEQDGPQSGILVLGSPDDEQNISGAWLDSWHQQPYPMIPTGRVTGPGQVLVGAEYGGGWSWQLDLRLTGQPQLVMRNVVPAEAITPEHPGEPGPYDVMVIDLA